MAKKRRRASKQARTQAQPASGGRPRQQRSASDEQPASAAPARAARSAQRLDWLLLGLAAAGIALTAYLTGVKWFGEQPAFCSAGSSCDVVQSSRWSTLFGVPMALWGLLTYVVLARFLWRLRSRPSAWRPALTIAAVGAAVSWYLTAVSVLEIETTCSYCLASFAIMNALLLLLLLRRPAHLPEHAWASAWPTPVSLATAVVLGLYLNFSGLFDPAHGPEDPYLKALATHLKETGARFYGAYWCPNCQDQKELFTASMERLPYVECTPSGRNGPMNVACLNANIRDYPTWVINDTRHGGVLPPRRLADLSGFRYDGVRR
jgi:uncharacterized membrane protein